MNVKEIVAVAIYIYFTSAFAMTKAFILNAIIQQSLLTRFKGSKEKFCLYTHSLYLVECKLHTEVRNVTSGSKHVERRIYIIVFK